MTARQRALINSAFYRILIRAEGEQIKRFIQQREVYLLQKSAGRAGPGGPINIMGEHQSLLLGLATRGEQQRFGPMIRVFRDQGEEEQMIQSMQKTYRSGTSANAVYDTARSSSNRVNPEARRTTLRLGSGATAPRPMFGGQKLQSSKNPDSKKFAFFTGQREGMSDLADEGGSVGSPKTSLFNVPGNMATKNKLRLGGAGPPWLRDGAQAGFRRAADAAELQAQYANSRAQVAMARTKGKSTSYTVSSLS